MKMYDYLVAYKFNAEGFLTSCEGTVQISRKKKIKTFEDLVDVKQFITDSLTNNYQKVSNVSIYNFILLGRNRH
jgi:hypothetical protein